MTYVRSLALPAPGEDTFFLWGPRQTGKSTLLKAHYREALWLDLLDAKTFRRLRTRPEELGEQVRATGAPFVVIDEVQKVPSLLDEVHRLHEQGTRFALCGSSARKVRRGHANLLGGRAIRFELFGLVSEEIGDAFDLERILNAGYLPRIHDAKKPERYLASYVADYLKEEIVAEGLVRELAPFDDFLRQAALSDAEPVSYTTIARECGVSAQTVRNYFQILEDTLLGRFLPAYAAHHKRRLVKSPKFYFHDVGVVNRLARRGTLERFGPLIGKAFENWVFHELSAYNAYRERDAALSYWRLSSGAEVDFIVNQMELALEVKATERARPEHLRHLRGLKDDHPDVKRRILLTLSEVPRTSEDGIEMLGPKAFCDMLWQGALF